ncbi:tocopherol cyclase family protein [Peloplasma aerotolerans]|uniref:Tocopherol cyclase family protein n=1 Tax=Peloplasma aerotolerans TaxID=3044389 RepID=A0AAW6U9N8_9MOLU|nr:tocopherol cyclase family protein [Mariniplasma sp. M4Ah]MDI6453147.1 tocopherol cyclase family protein [Mariniplasma sp. M4Ah]
MCFKKLIHPEYFQGEKKKNRYFEGWYYKLVSKDDLYTLAFIPGVSINEIDPHAFIQVFLSKNDPRKTKLSSHYLRFDLDAFDYGNKEFWIRIDKNYFSKEKIFIDMKNDKMSIIGTLKLSGLTPLKKNMFSPNIMGIFGYLSFMECYHGVISMTHQLDGAFKINDEIISFESSKGYIEKDWGRSFPRSYVWIQSNHFKNPETSLMFSYADIPFIGFYFKGLIANLIYEGKEYRFATYNFTKVQKEEIKDNYVFYKLIKGKYRLEIEALSTSQIGLASPKDGMMTDQIKEGLSGHVNVRLYIKNKLIYEDIGKHAGIEVMKQVE